jgi:hypothetical protein
MSISVRHDSISTYDDIQTPDLETSYSRCPNSSLYRDSAINGKDLGVSAIITERQQQLEVVLHEISGLETIMDSVKNLQQKLVDKMEKITLSMSLHRGLLSALWRFPNEVLAQIFHDCLPESTLWERPFLSTDPNRDAPMHLARICRRWREVVVDMPRLWCKLHLRRRGVWEQAAFGYNSWLRRSRGFPLSLALECFQGDEIQLRSIIQPYIGHITALYVDFYGNANPEHLLKDIPALQRLSISSTHNIPAMTQSALRLPPTLRSFKLMGLDLTDRLIDLGSIFAQLTNIEITIHPSALLRLLKISPNLASLTFSLGSSFWTSTRPLQPFMHTKIQSLCIKYGDAKMLSKLFNALSLPILRTLTVAHGVRELPHAELKALLTRSNCPLESLVFEAGVTTDAQRAGYLALMPSLEVTVDHTFEEYL